MGMVSLVCFAAVISSAVLNTNCLGNRLNKVQYNAAQRENNKQRKSKIWTSRELLMRQQGADLQV